MADDDLIDVVVSINLRGLTKFRKVTETDLQGATNGPIRKAINQWAYRYRVFAQRRFDVFSKGGGNWPPLSPGTLKGRRKGSVRRASTTGKTDKRFKTSAAILRNTGLLFNALAPAFTGAPGALQQNIPYGVRVGYGGPGVHPGGRVTIADIANFHNAGMGRNPKRKIIENPDQATRTGMEGDMTKAMKSLANETINGNS